MTTSTPPARLAINGGTPVSRETIPIVSVRLEQADIEAAAQVLRSGMLAQGDVTRRFEQRFAEMTGARHAIACANGTVALQLAYHALLEPESSAIVPGWTFFATASMVRARPAVPVFADVRPDTFNLDPQDAAGLVTAPTRVIVPVHLYGQPADLGAILALARQRGLRVVQDAAQAHLATYDGRGLGEFGDAVTYSFYATKNMTTGEGGMVTTNDDRLADEMRLIRDHGAPRRYVHETLGFNWRLTDVASAVGLSQLERLPERTARRQENARRLDAQLAGIDGIAPPAVSPQATHVYHLYTCRFDAERFTCDRATFLEALRGEGVATAVHYPRPVNRQPMFENDPEVDTRPLPVSERLADEVFSLPVHPDLTARKLDQIAEAVAKVAAAFARR